MEADLRDALIAWQDGDLPPKRVNELLERVRNDAAFRRAGADFLSLNTAEPYTAALMHFFENRAKNS